MYTPEFCLLCPKSAHSPDCIYLRSHVKSLYEQSIQAKVYAQMQPKKFIYIETYDDAAPDDDVGDGDGDDEAEDEDN